MIVALDVQYDDANDKAVVGVVTFAEWTSESPIAEYAIEVEGIQPYVPGKFRERELPCLLKALQSPQTPDSYTCIVVDGYVDLGPGRGPGLGRALYDALGQTVPVVGVAKTSFSGAESEEVYRNALKPLLVTAAGISSGDARDKVVAMAGKFRMPWLLKRVDQLARGIE